MICVPRGGGTPPLENSLSLSLKHSSLLHFIERVKKGHITTTPTSISRDMKGVIARSSMSPQYSESL